MILLLQQVFLIIYLKKRNKKVFSSSFLRDIYHIKTKNSRCTPAVFCFSDLVVHRFFAVDDSFLNRFGSAHLTGGSALDQEFDLIADGVGTGEGRQNVGIIQLFTQSGQSDIAGNEFLEFRKFGSIVVGGESNQGHSPFRSI